MGLSVIDARIPQGSTEIRHLISCLSIPHIYTYIFQSTTAGSRSNHFRIFFTVNVRTNHGRLTSQHFSDLFRSGASIASAAVLSQLLRLRFSLTTLHPSLVAVVSKSQLRTLATEFTTHGVAKRHKT